MTHQLRVLSSSIPASIATQKWHLPGKARIGDAISCATARFLPQGCSHAALDGDDLNSGGILRQISSKPAELPEFLAGLTWSLSQRIIKTTQNKTNVIEV